MMISPYTQLYSFETICLYFDRSERVFDSRWRHVPPRVIFITRIFSRSFRKMDKEEAWVVNISLMSATTARVLLYRLWSMPTVCLCIPPIRRAISQFPYAMRELRRMLLPFFPTNDNSYHAVVTFCDPAYLCHGCSSVRALGFFSVR